MIDQGPGKHNEGWIRIASLLGLRANVIPAAQCGLPDSWPDVVVFVDFGARNGMIVLPDRTGVVPYAESLSSRGFGFSVVEPGDLSSSDGVEGVREMFRDWGWTGPETERPSWCSC